MSADFEKQNPQKGQSSDYWNCGDDDLESIPIPEADDPDLFDPFCDPKNPRSLKFHEISNAAFQIQNGIRRTPCQKSNLSKMFGMKLYFKKDFEQTTGSFKERGARYTLQKLNSEERKRGVIAASAGNHALAISYHAKSLGIPVIVVMPVTAPIVKISSCIQYGAKVLVKGMDLAESKKLALKIAKLKRMVYINGYDHPNILAGQGTMGLEILEQVPDVDAILVPVGGGGLLAGIAVAVKSLNPLVQIIGVESIMCPSFNESMKANRVIYTPAMSTLADGLAVAMVGYNSLHTCLNLVDRMIQVDEEFIALAILRLIEVEKAVVEGAGATGFAAILADKCPDLKGKKVVIPLCGGNIDSTVLGRSIERGLAADGRLVQFQVEVSDRPGGIAELTARLWHLGVSVKDIFHERAWVKSDIFSVRVKCIVETRNGLQAKQLEEDLHKNYRKVWWGPGSGV